MLNLMTMVAVAMVQVAAQSPSRSVGVVRGVAGRASVAGVGRVAVGGGAMASTPPAPWTQGDQGEQAYRAAREALNKGQYQKAAEGFASLADKYPKSAYAPDALYWQAYALYKNGDLNRAREALDKQGRLYPEAAKKGDAPVLMTRIKGDLARGGDAGAAAEISEVASGASAGSGGSSGSGVSSGGSRSGRGGQGQSGCPREDDDMRAVALNALMEMDADQALPVLKEVLAKRGPCTMELRKKAVFLVGQHETPEAANMLVGVIRNDPEEDVKESAVFWLSQTKDDRAIVILDSILRGSDNPDIRDKALFAISQFDGPKAHAALRGYAERSDVSEETRAKAVFWLGQSSPSDSDMAFLKSLYEKTTSERMHDAVIQAVSESHGGTQWLLSLATNDKMSLDSRKKALFWAGENGASVTDLTGLYPRLTDRDMREQLLFVLSQRNESVATDKLIDIAKNDPDRDLRKKAIFWLGQKRDPRVKDLLLEIINKP